MINFELKYKRYGASSILIEWPSKIEKETLKDVLLYKNRIQNSNIEDILYINNAYCSIIISYVFTIDNIYDKFSELKRLYLSRFSPINNKNKLWKIPVCYDDKFGVDLDYISKAKQCSIKQIINWHIETKYTVYFIGFLPGFLYLGGLNSKLHIERRNSPRLQIPKGSVAIGGQQTGIYPNESPGGWHIIGNSPIEFFNIRNKVPCFAQAGDRVQFISINPIEYDEISELIEHGHYQIESEVIHD